MSGNFFCLLFEQARLCLAFGNYAAKILAGTGRRAASARAIT